MKKLALAEFVILLIGTLFAWTNFSIEFYSWYTKTRCLVSCTQGAIVNPFLTPCFYGALFFTLAFVVSIFIWKKASK